MRRGGLFAAVGAEGKLPSGQPARTPALRLPGVYQANAAALEIGGVARRQKSAAGVSDGGDLRVEVRDGTTLGAATERNLRKRACSVFVEGQNASGEDFAEHSFHTREERGPSFSVRQEFDSIQDLRQCDGCDK